MKAQTQKDALDSSSLNQPSTEVAPSLNSSGISDSRQLELLEASGVDAIQLGESKSPKKRTGSIALSPRSKKSSHKTQESHLF